MLAGVRNPFDLKQNGVSPTLSLQPEDFVLLLTHTPDYVEDVDVSNTDLALAGHTHGGQVSLFKRWTPARFSKYGNRFFDRSEEKTAGEFLLSSAMVSELPVKMYGYLLPVKWF